MLGFSPDVAEGFGWHYIELLIDSSCFLSIILPPKCILAELPQGDLPCLMIVVDIPTSHPGFKRLHSASPPLDPTTSQTSEVSTCCGVDFPHTKHP